MYTDVVTSLSFCVLRHFALLVCLLRLLLSRSPSIFKRYVADYVVLSYAYAHLSMWKGSLVMNTINVRPLVRRTAVRSYIPTLPALCLGTSVPRQKEERERERKGERFVYTVNNTLHDGSLPWLGC